MKKLNHINQVSRVLKGFLLGLAVGATVVFGVGQSAHAATTTQTYDLGTNPSGTYFASAGYGSLFTWIAQGSLPAGSILRSVTVTDLAVVAPNDGGNWASDLGVYVDPTPGNNNGDGLLRISDDDNFGGAATSINYLGQGQNDGPFTLTLSAPANFPTTIDLSAAAVMLGSAYAPGTFSGTVTVEYDVPPTAVILTFGGAPGGSVIIDQGAKTIVWTLPVGTDVTALAPTYTLTTGVCVPASGSPQNFTSPVTYTVTDPGVITNVYTVTVNLVAFSGMVNVNFTGTARAGLNGPRGDIGEVWNQLNGSLSSLEGGTASALQDSAGLGTTIGVSISGYNGLDEWGNPALQLIRDGLRIFNTGAGQLGTLVINNLPSDRKYNVYIASANASGGESSAGAFATTNATTTSGSQPCVNTGAVNGSTWAQGNNYVLFENVVPDGSGIIRITGTNTGGFRSPINGFQVSDVGSSLNDKNILIFGGAPGNSAIIDQNAATIAWTMPFGTDVTSLSPTYTVTPGATGAPASGSTNNFTTPQTYTVTGADTTTKDYLVTVSVTPASAANNILTFVVAGGNTTITGTNIAVVMALGTDVTGLVPTYTVSPFANGSPASGVANNFTVPQTYTVTAQDSSTQDYLVTVQLVASSGRVNVNFTSTARTGLEGPAGGLGEVWNQLNLSLISLEGGTASALWDSAGVPTAIGVSFSGYNGLDNWGNPALQLIRDGLRIFSTAAGQLGTLVINNLPSDRKYDVYIASANASGGESSDGVFSTANTMTTVGSQPCVNTGAVNGDTWAQGNNYVLFANVVPNAGNITITGTNTGGFRSPINGFQVVDVGPVVVASPIPTVTSITGPVASEFTIHGSTDIAGNVVVEKTASLDAPIVWVSIQTNAVPGGIFGIVVSQGAESQMFYRLKGQ